MIYRIDVRARDGVDPLGSAVCQQVRQLGKSVESVQTSRIFLLDTDSDQNGVARIARELLADPIVESAEIFNPESRRTNESRIEVHLKPGVMDPVAASTEMAVRDLGVKIRQVRTGRAYVIEPKLDRRDLESIAARVVANGVVESVHFEPYCPDRFEIAAETPPQVRHVNVRELSDFDLAALSRQGHLFLSLEEMKAIQQYYRDQNREPTDIELETIAQTWSEHCVHKTLKSAVEVEVRDRQGHKMSSRSFGNLIRDTIFSSTIKLMESENKREPFCLSAFKDNAGAVAFDESDAVCFKVETHNHPSAIEPYGGSATGAGGVIRDILGAGLAARPVANTDVFCVAPPDVPRDGLPKGVIHPRRILQQVVAGVRDYGNRMGIPTVNGAVYFDPRYLGNPLVFCGCVGIIPRDKLEKAAQRGDAIVLMGGRTGRDGIHGATFSSAELTESHADEFSHAVQIGNAITEKKMADVILAARDSGLFTAITDCGAGGLSSAVGEMGEKIGAVVELEKVPLKYVGLRHDEIWISEAQERMVLAVPPEHLQSLLDLASGEDVEATVIGSFGTAEGDLILNFRGQQVGRLSMQFLHHGIPMPTRKAVVVEQPRKKGVAEPFDLGTFKTKLLLALADPNIASKHWIIRQYDHEVQGGSVVKPLVGPMQIGPSDAAVVRPKLGSAAGVVIGCGLAPQIEDPYEMAIAAIDEAVRNVVAVGADPDRMALLDNFCWPSVEDELTLGTLVRACEACRDAALAYGIPFISGKDSLNNQFTNKETGQVLRIPRTLLISAIGVIQDVRRCVTMDFKTPTGAPVYLVSTNSTDNLHALAATHRAMAKLIASGHVAAVHDISDGGLAVAAAEMIIASGRGLNLDPEFLATSDPFAERPGRYIVEFHASAFGAWADRTHPTVQGREVYTRPIVNDPLHKALCGQFGSSATVTRLGFVQTRPGLLLVSRLAEGIKVHAEISAEEMTRAWRGTLDW
jgi:phosphoribosylformylglycinamidine synthase subunit PurSL